MNLCRKHQVKTSSLNLKLGQNKIKWTTRKCLGPVYNQIAARWWLWTWDTNIRALGTLDPLEGRREDWVWSYQVVFHVCWEEERRRGGTHKTLILSLPPLPPCVPPLTRQCQRRWRNDIHLPGEKCVTEESIYAPIQRKSHCRNIFRWYINKNRRLEQSN